MGQGRGTGDAAWIDEAAGLLLDNRLAPGPLVELPDSCRPHSEADAYAVQEALHPRLTEAGLGPVAGYKIGCTTPVMQRFLGIDSPCAGAVFAATVHHRSGRLPHAAFHHVGVECEIAVRLARDLTPAEAPFDRTSVRAAVESCMAAIEVVDDRYRDYRAVSTPTLIADDFFNAACVLGEPVADWAGLDLPRLAGRMSINGREVGSGLGADILGHPLDALCWLVNARVGRGLAVEAGRFVLLGSLVQTRWVETGDHVLIEIDQLGEAGVAFT